MALIGDEFRSMLMVVMALLLVLGFKGTLMDDEEFKADHPMDNMINSIKEKAAEHATQTLIELTSNAQDQETADDDESDTRYDDLINAYDGVIEAVKDKGNAYAFIKAKGFQKVVVNQLGIDNPSVKARLLILVKTLFEVVPVSANAVAPKGMVGKVLDIFENDDNLALKAHALDVLVKWLPNNPEIQTKVMKLKGLEPFYSQINKLDVYVIKTLLDLFNTIIKEHVVARSDDKNSVRIDKDRLVMYKKIGLLERVETPNVCKGLINVFEVIWANKEDTDMVKTVFDLVKTTKPFCGGILKNSSKGKSRVVAMFNNFLDYIKNLKPDMESKINATDMRAIIEEYVDAIKPVKDEF